MNSITKPQAQTVLKDCIETVYVITCDRCDGKLQHSFAVAPKGESDLSYVAEMAYEDGWAATGKRGTDGEIETGALCPECAKKPDRVS